MSLQRHKPGVVLPSLLSVPGPIGKLKAYLTPWQWLPFSPKPHDWSIWDAGNICSDSLFPEGDLDTHPPPQSPELVHSEEVREKKNYPYFCTFALLHACYSYVFHSCFTLCLETHDSPYILYTNAAMLNMQSSAGSNPRYQHRAHREK